MSTQMQVPFGLINAVKSRQVVLFAGAGISFKSINVGALTLRDALGAEIQGNYPGYDFSKRSIEDVCDEYAALSDRISLVNRLASLIPRSAAPLASHLAAVKTFRFIVTTNWDLLFEAAYSQINQGYQCLASEADAPNFSYDQHNLLKIHGTADRPLTLIATSDDYENYNDKHPLLLQRITDLLHQNTVLFVGYGLRDEHVRHLLAHIRRERGEWANKNYAIGFYDDVRTKLLESRGIEVLPYDAADFLPELAKRAGV